MHDVTIFTEGEVITEEICMNFEKVELDMLGTCKKVIVLKDDTIILDEDGDQKIIEEICEKIRSKIELSNYDYDKQKVYINIMVIDHVNFGKSVTIDHLVYKLVEDLLEEMFFRYERGCSIVIMKDSNGSSRGFGFVNFQIPDDAKKALTAMNGVIACIGDGSFLVIG